MRKVKGLIEKKLLLYCVKGVYLGGNVSIKSYVFFVDYYNYCMNRSYYIFVYYDLVCYCYR